LEQPQRLLLLVGILINHNNKAIKIGPQEDVGRTAFHAASYGRRYFFVGILG
jgi:hypothetical protein